MDPRIVRSSAAPSERSQMWPSNPTLDLEFDEWFGLIDRDDTAPRARLEALSGPGGTHFVVAPEPSMRAHPFRASSSPTRDTWPIDSTTDLSDDEWLGLVDRIDRTPRARIEVLTGPAGTMAVVTGWSDYPAMASRFPSPVTSAVQPSATAASAESALPTPKLKPSARSHSSAELPPPSRVATTQGSDAGDGERLLSTIEAARYLDYSGASSLRRAKGLGHIAPDATGPRRAALYRRATLDEFRLRFRDGEAPAEGAVVAPPSAPIVDAAPTAPTPAEQRSDTPAQIPTELSAPPAPLASADTPPAVTLAASIIDGASVGWCFEGSPEPRQPSFVADVARVLLIVGLDGLHVVLATASSQVPPALHHARCMVGVPLCVTLRCRAVAARSELPSGLLDEVLGRRLGG